MFKKNKKGNFSIDMLQNAVLSLLVLGLIVVVVQVILGQMADNTTLAPTNSFAANTIAQTQESVATVPTWFTIILTVIIAVALILLVLVFRKVNQGK